MADRIDQSDLDVLIQRIYDAAVDPDGWSEVAGLFRDVFESPGGGLFVQDCCTQAFRPVSMFGLPERDLAWYEEYYCETNAWALAGLQRPGWTITDQSVDRVYHQRGAFAESEFCNDWLKPLGYRYGMGGTVKAFGTEYFHYTILRPPGAHPFGFVEVEAFNILKSHLGRAVELSSRLRTLRKRLDGHSAVLDWLPIGVALLDDAARVHHANAKAGDLMEPGAPLRLRQGNLRCHSRTADGRLQRILSDAQAFRDGGASAGAYATTVALPDGTRPVSVVAVPLSRTKPLFSDPSLALAVFLGEPGDPLPLDCDRLQQAYGLTRSEARLVAQLAREQDLIAAAHRVGVSPATARTYLKSVFRKTGTGGQTELIGRLLSDAALVVAGPAER